MEGKPLHIYFSVTCFNFQNFWTKFIQWWNNKNNDSISLIKEHMIITKFRFILLLEMREIIFWDAF